MVDNQDTLISGDLEDSTSIKDIDLPRYIKKLSYDGKVIDSTKFLRRIDQATGLKRTEILSIMQSAAKGAQTFRDFAEEQRTRNARVEHHEVSLEDSGDAEDEIRVHEEAAMSYQEIEAHLRQKILKRDAENKQK